MPGGEGFEVDSKSMLVYEIESCVCVLGLASRGHVRDTAMRLKTETTERRLSFVWIRLCNHTYLACFMVPAPSELCQPLFAWGASPRVSDCTNHSPLRWWKPTAQKAERKMLPQAALDHDDA